MKPCVETTKMSTKGQVIIPKCTREFTHSGENTIFTVLPIDEKTIVLKKLNTQEILAEFRSFRSKVKRKVSEAEVNELVRKTR